MTIGWSPSNPLLTAIRCSLILLYDVYIFGLYDLFTSHENILEGAETEFSLARAAEYKLSFERYCQVDD